MKRSLLLLAVAAALAVMISISGCVRYNEIAMQVGAPPELEENGSTVNLRVLQTRQFDTLDEHKLLVAGTQAMQDLGFNITETSSRVGILVGSKQRDARESGQVAGQVALSIGLALFGVYHQPLWDKEQDIVVNLVTMPIENSAKTEVRVSFERLLTNNHGQLWRTEVILDEEIYQEFFSLFAQSAFLEAEER